MVTNSMPLASSKKTAFAFLPVLTGLFTATLLISNVLNCKVIRVGPLPFTGGLIMFPFGGAFWRCADGGLRLRGIPKGHLDRPRLAGPVRDHDRNLRRAAGRLPLDASSGLRCDPWSGPTDRRGIIDRLLRRRVQQFVCAGEVQDANPRQFHVLAFRAVDPGRTVHRQRHVRGRGFFRDECRHGRWSWSRLRDGRSWWSGRSPRFH